MEEIFIHASAEVSEESIIKRGTKIWNWTKVREKSRIGEDCNIGQCVYIDLEVKIGDRCKIQNGVQIYKGVEIEDDVFIGPNVTFTNDRYPRIKNIEWSISPTVVKNGVSIGAGSVILFGITIGENAMIAAGSVIINDVPPNTLVAGNPAKVKKHLNDFNPSNIDFENKE